MCSTNLCFFPIVSGRVKNMYVSECLGIINLLFCHSETAKQFKPDMIPSVASVFMVDILIMSSLVSLRDCMWKNKSIKYDSIWQGEQVCISD